MSAVYQGQTRDWRFSKPKRISFITGGARYWSGNLFFLNSQSIISMPDFRFLQKTNSFVPQSATRIQQKPWVCRHFSTAKPSGSTFPCGRDHIFQCQKTRSEKKLLTLSGVSICAPCPRHTQGFPLVTYRPLSSIQVKWKLEENVSMK